MSAPARRRVASAGQEYRGAVIHGESSGIIKAVRNRMIRRESDIPSRRTPGLGVSRSRPLFRRTGKFLRDPATGAVFQATPLTFPGPVPAPSMLERIEQLRHPSLLPIHRVGEAYGEPLRFQEVEEGATLEECVHDHGGDMHALWSRVFPERSLGWIHGIASLALLADELLEAGVSPGLEHPDQIRITRDGRVLLPARELLQAGGRDIDGSTAPFLPSEVLLTTRTASHPRPEEVVYTLAAFLHYGLTGAPPYPGRDPAEVANRILERESPTAGSYHADIPRAVAELLQTALSFDPRGRPATLKGFSHALAAAAVGKRTWASGIRRGRAGWPRRRTTVAAGLCLVCIAIASYQVWRRHQAREFLCTQIARALHSRPFPIHGEDPPHHPVAQQVLHDHQEELEEWRRDSRVQVLRGWALVRARRLAEALHCFQSVVRDDGVSIPGWVSLGIARLESNDPGGRVDLAQGLQLQPRGCRDWLFRGAGHFYLLEFSDSRHAFQQVVALEPHSFPGWIHLALAAHYDSDLVAAESALDRARRLQPRNLWVGWLEAELLASAEPGRAVQRVQRDEARFLSAPSLQLRVGHLLMRVGETHRGASWIEQARARITSDAATATLGATGPGEPIEWCDRGRLVWPRRATLLAGPPGLR